MGGVGGADLARIVFHIGCLAKLAIGQDGKHGDGAAEVVGDEQVLAGWVNAGIGGAGAARTDGVEQLEGAIFTVDGEGADGAVFFGADAVGLIGGIEAGAGGIDREATGAGAHFVDAGLAQRAGGAVDLKQVDAPAIARWQVDLGGEHIFQG